MMRGQNVGDPSKTYSHPTPAHFDDTEQPKTLKQTANLHRVFCLRTEWRYDASSGLGARPVNTEGATTKKSNFYIAFLVQGLANLLKATHRLPLE